MTDYKEQLSKMNEEYHSLTDRDLDLAVGGSLPYEQDQRYIELMKAYERINNDLAKIADPNMAALYLSSLRDVIKKISEIKREYGY